MSKLDNILKEKYEDALGFIKEYEARNGINQQALSSNEIGYVLGQYGTILIHFAERDETIQISGNGNVKYDLIVTGSEENIFNGQSTSAWTNGGPNKLDRTAHYINLLNESMRSGADVRTEIETALRSFKNEARI